MPATTGYSVPKSTRVKWGTSSPMDMGNPWFPEDRDPQRVDFADLLEEYWKNRLRCPSVWSSPQRGKSGDPLGFVPSLGIIR